MGYFPNGTAGDRYEVMYCEKCAHYPDTEIDCTAICPVMHLHKLWNGEQFAPGDAEPDELTVMKFTALEALIPTQPSGENRRCALFVPAAPPGPTRTQLVMAELRAEILGETKTP